MKLQSFILFFYLIIIYSCKNLLQKSAESVGFKGNESTSVIESAAVPSPALELTVADSLPSLQINTGSVHPDSIVNFAQTLIGTPYLYASSNPENGFDCSGFITYVFNHFNIKVPRSSYEFANAGTPIPLAESKKGDLILFTGTDSTETRIGHMGIILSNEQSNVQFIHSSSGKAHGVTISPLDKHYQKRFVKVVRIFPRLYHIQ